MVVLLTGASGFIGRHLAKALQAEQHEVIFALRRPNLAPGMGQGAREDTRQQTVAADFTRDFEPDDWLPRLAGVDVVINAVGIIREQGAQTFDAIHSKAPRALFAACAKAGVKRVIQISALGADGNAHSRYHLSKKHADDFLAELPIESVIVQPSLIYGSGGTSARMFNTLASLPLIPLPGTGQQAIQPVHIDDVVDAIVALLDRPITSGARIPLLGPQAMSLREFLSLLRILLRLGSARFIAMPMFMVRTGASLGKFLPGSLLDIETLQMLERGNTGSEADVLRMELLIGRPPRAVRDFIALADAPAARLATRLNWLLPILRFSIALVWIVTGIVSLGLYPVADSYALLARVGIEGMLAPIALYGAALMDIAFGIAILVMKRRYWLWLAQIAVIVFYTAVITVKLPEFWLHPYGPLLKNLPMLAAIWLLLELEKK